MGLPTWLSCLRSRPLRPDSSFDFRRPIRKAPGQRMLDIALTLDLPTSESRRYGGSVVYFDAEPSRGFSADRCIPFRVMFLRQKQTVRVALPEEVSGAKAVRIKVVPAPGAREGSYRILGAAFRDGPGGDELDRLALLEELKAKTRRAARISEEEMVATCGHYPTSLQLELTSRCNFACVFCATHGKPDAKAYTNAFEPLSLENLDRLAAEVFPSLSMVILVGRGEPTLADDRLWSAFSRHAAENRIVVSMMTNGSLITRRITEDVLPWLGEMVVSIDGATDETLKRNRIGSSWPKLLEGLRHFNELRFRSDLARIPQLAISFVARRNNIAELPALVRAMLPFRPDAFYVRHLIVFSDDQRSESLLGHEDYANPFFEEAYDLLAKHGIRTDCPPIMKKAIEDSGAATGCAAGACKEPEETSEGCTFMHSSGTLYCNGDMKPCCIPNMPLAGTFGEQTSFLDVWNGPVMRDIRASFGTEREWEECRHCLLRQSRSMTQRTGGRSGQERVDLKQAVEFTPKVWDHRKRSQPKLNS